MPATLVTLFLLAHAAAAQPEPSGTARRRELERVAHNYQISPSGYRDPQARGYLSSRYSFLYQTPEAWAWRPRLQAPLASADYPVPPAVAYEQRFNAILLAAAVRALVFCLAVILMARLAPPRIWTEILDSNNIALAIVLAALALGLGMVIVAPAG